MSLLLIAKCGYAELQPKSDSNSYCIPTIVGYDTVLPVEGNTITFMCPPGLELVGPNSATCTRNGEWEPDPRGLMCTGE